MNAKKALAVHLKAHWEAQAEEKQQQVLHWQVWMHQMG